MSCHIAVQPPGVGRRGPFVPHKMCDLAVELSTSSGLFFSTTASSIDVRTEDGSVHITPREESYLNMIHATEITLQTANGPCGFMLENAVAGLKGRTFTVLAESVRRIEPQALVEPNA
jgi:F0F1-type ATP synthase epsilon subunit